jgi:hypothetical protein
VYFHNVFLTAAGFLPGNLQNFALDVIRILSETNRKHILDKMILKINQSVTVLDRTVSKDRA